MGKIELSVISPLYNEENVELFYLSLTQALESVGLDYEVILVDDGSNREIASSYDALAHKDSHVKIIRHPGNLGKQAAILSGFSACRAEKILVLDGDIEVKAVDIQRFCSMLDQGFDVLFGNRKAWHRPFSRRVLSACLNLLVSLVALRRIRDVGTGFCLFSRKLFSNVIDHQEKTNTSYYPINILAFFLADNPCELQIESLSMKRKSRYSPLKLIKFAILVLQKLYTLLPPFGQYLSPQAWGRVAKKIDVSLDNSCFAYFRDDKHLCYREFYGLNPHSGKVLDVGCGPGHFVLFCADKGMDITGIDVSHGMLNLTKKRLQKQGLFACLMRIDVSKGLPFQNGTFDTVICESVLNHLHNPVKVLREIARVLKDDGYVVVDVSNGWGVAWRLAIALSQLFGDYPKGYINWVNPVKAHNLAHSSGFQVVKSRGLHFLPPPKIISIGFKSHSLLPSRVEALLERKFFKLNYLLEQGFPFKYLCFKYLIRCRKRI